MESMCKQRNFRKFYLHSLDVKLENEESDGKVCQCFFVNSFGSFFVRAAVV